MMRKNVDIDDLTLKKIKLISAYENISVKALLEKAIRTFVKNKELEKYASLTDEEKEDIGLLALMQQNDPEDTVTEDEIFELLQK